MGWHSVYINTRHVEFFRSRQWITHSIYLLYSPNEMRVIKFLKDKKNRERSSNKIIDFNNF